MVKTTTTTQTVEEQINENFIKAQEALETKGFVRYTIKGTDRVYNTTRLEQLKLDERDFGITGVVE